MSSTRDAPLPPISPRFHNFRLVAEAAVGITKYPKGVDHRLRYWQTITVTHKNCTYRALGKLGNNLSYCSCTWDIKDDRKFGFLGTPLYYIFSSSLHRCMGSHTLRSHYWYRRNQINLPVGHYCLDLKANCQTDMSEEIVTHFIEWIKFMKTGLSTICLWNKANLLIGWVLVQRFQL